MAGEVAVGSLLRVPFARRSALGVVVELADRSELAPDRLAEPERVIGAGLTPELVALAEWMAREYCSTPARALSLMLPAGAAAGRGAKRSLAAKLTAEGAAALALDRGTRPGLGSPTASGRSLDAAGAMRRDRARGRARHRGTAPPGAPRAGDDRLADRPAAARQSTVGRADIVPPPLTADQRTAADALLAALGAPGGATRDELLLQGVTGSGKTEVYLGGGAGGARRRAHGDRARARDRAHAAGARPLPGPLRRRRRRAALGALATASATTSGCGCASARRGCASDRARPCSRRCADIGLIVVDEEHESSYKHEGDPRYDARARGRAGGRAAHGARAGARQRDAAAGDACTSCAGCGCRSGVDGRPMPPVELLDMRDRHQPLHPETRMALADLRHAGGKAIVLLNRRGWSNFLSCRACGRVWMCPNCEVALVLHRDRRATSPAITAAIASRCRSAARDCASVSVARHGAGTERVEHELARGARHRRLPGASASTPTPASLERPRADAAARSRRRRAGVLVGTQMVAKGHDFPDVVARRRARRRPDAALPGLPRRGADVRAGHPARRPGGPGRRRGRATRPRARADARARRAVDRASPPEHDSDGFVADELRAPASAPLPAVRVADPGRLLAPRTSRAAQATRAAAIHARAGARRGAVLGPAPLFRLRGRAPHARSSSRRADRARRDRRRRRAPSTRSPGAPPARGVAVSVDVDPVRAASTHP